MAKSLSMNGRKKIETVQKEFTGKFNYLTLLFLDEEMRPIDINRSLAEVRTTKGQDISLVASLKVNTLEQKFRDNFGLTVEVVYAQNGKVLHTEAAMTKTLNELNQWCGLNNCDNLLLKKPQTANTASNTRNKLFNAGENHGIPAISQQPELITQADVTKRLSEFYCDNVWEREDYTLVKKPFPNVVRTRREFESLFRKFTPQEIDSTVNKISKTGCYIYLPFIKEILGREIDMASFKPPFWFIPNTAYGNNVCSFFYFEENGVYNNFDESESMTLVAHVDTWKNLSVESGYNGLFNSQEDDRNLSSLRINWHNPKSGNSGAINVVDFHGPESGTTFKIMQAIWECGWKKVVDRSRGGSQFFHESPDIELFDSWDDLLKWAKG